MINAGLSIRNKGEYTNGNLSTSIGLNYPLSLPDGTHQDITNNSITVNDLLIDNDGNIWKIDSLTYNQETTEFDCNLSIQNSESKLIDEIISLEKCSIITPKSNGLLAPYYHDSYVSTRAFRAAMSYNMLNFQKRTNYKSLEFFDFNGTLNSLSTSNSLIKFGTPALQYQTGCGLSNDTTGIMINNNVGMEYHNFSELVLQSDYSIELEFTLNRPNSFESIIVFENKNIDNTFEYTRLCCYDQHLQLSSNTENCFDITQFTTTTIDNTKVTKVKLEKFSNKIVLFVNGVKESEYIFTIDNFKNIVNLYFFNNKFDALGLVFSGLVCNIKISSIYPSNEILHFNFLNSLISDSVKEDELIIVRTPIVYQTIPEIPETKCLNIKETARLKLENITTLLPDQTNFMIELNLQLNTKYGNTNFSYVNMSYTLLNLINYTSTISTTIINKLLFYTYVRFYMLFNDNTASLKTLTTIDDNIHSTIIYPNEFTNIKFVKEGSICNLYVNDERLYFRSENDYVQNFALGDIHYNYIGYDYLYFDDIITDLYFYDTSYNSNYDINLLIDYIKIYSGTYSNNTLVADFNFNNQDLKCSINPTNELKYEYLNINKNYILGILDYNNYNHNDQLETKEVKLNTKLMEFVSLQDFDLSILDQTNFILEINFGLSYNCNLLKIKSYSDVIDVITIGFRDDIINDKSFIHVSNGKLDISLNFGAQDSIIKLVKFGNIFNIYVNDILANVINENDENIGPDIPFIFFIKELIFGQNTPMYLLDIKLYSGTIEDNTLIHNFKFENSMKCSLTETYLIYNQILPVLSHDVRWMTITDQSKSTVKIYNNEYLKLPSFDTLITDKNNFVIDVTFLCKPFTSGYSSNYLYCIYPFIIFSRSEIILNISNTGYDLKCFKDISQFPYDEMIIFNDINKIYSIKLKRRGNKLSILLDDVPLGLTNAGYPRTDLGTEYDFSENEYVLNLLDTLTDIYFYKQQSNNYGYSPEYFIDSIKIYEGINETNGFLISSFDFDNTLECSLNPQHILELKYNTLVEDNSFVNYQNGIYGFVMPQSIMNLTLEDFKSKIENTTTYTIHIECTFHMQECGIPNCPHHTVKLLQFGQNDDSVKLIFRDKKFWLEGFNESENQIITYTQTEFDPTIWYVNPNDSDNLHCNSLWCDIRFVRNNNNIQLYVSRKLSYQGETDSHGMTKQFECTIQDNRLDESSLILFDYYHNFNNIYIYDVFIKSGTSIT